MQNSIEMIGFCFLILHLLFMVSPRHLLIFSSDIKVIDKLFEEKLVTTQHPYKKLLVNKP